MINAICGALFLIGSYCRAAPARKKLAPTDTACLCKVKAYCMEGDMLGTWETAQTAFGGTGLFFSRLLRPRKYCRNYAASIHPSPMVNR